MSRDTHNIRDVAQLREAFGLVGLLLEAEGTDVAIAVVGGSALLLNGRLVRVTRDVDVTAFIDDGVVSDSSPYAEDLIRHVSAVALEPGFDADWLNFGPMSLLDAGLPDGFLTRCRVERFGGPTVFVANRYDLIHMKLYAAVGQGPESKHMFDLRALDPTAEELDAARAWCRTQDVSDAFAKEVDAAVVWVMRDRNDR